MKKGYQDALDWIDGIPELALDGVDELLIWNGTEKEIHRWQLFDKREGEVFLIAEDAVYDSDAAAESRENEANGTDLQDGIPGWELDEAPADVGNCLFPMQKFI